MDLLIIITVITQLLYCVRVTVVKQRHIINHTKE